MTRGSSLEEDLRAQVRNPRHRIPGGYHTGRRRLQQRGRQPDERAHHGTDSSGIVRSREPGRRRQDRDVCRRRGRRGRHLRRRQDRGSGQPDRHPARLGELRPDDHRLHGKVRDQGPVRPARRRQRGRDQRGHRTWPAPAASPTSSTSPRGSPWPTPTNSHRTRWPPGPTSPTPTRRPTGLWTNNYTGFQSIAYDASLGDITKVADLADPKYKGKVALNGDPLKAGAGFNGVVLAALANGGSADNIAPGVDFFKKLTDSGNLIPVDPAPATIASGQTPIVIDWTYNEGSQIPVVQPKGINWKVVVPTDAPPVAAFYNSAINKDAAHPAAARCWLEYIFSDAGQNTWLKGGAMPVRLAAMQKAGTLDQAALAAVNPPTTPVVQLTPAQVDAATQYLKDNWKFISIK